MKSALIPFLSLVGILVTGLITWAVARRQTSGSPEQTPASELFLNMRSELARLQGRVSEVEGRLATAEADLNVSQREVIALQSEAAMLRQLVREVTVKLESEEQDNAYELVREVNDKLEAEEERS